jgi:hypothetical protein
MKLFARSHLGRWRKAGLMLLAVLIAAGPAAWGGQKAGEPDFSDGGATPAPKRPKFDVPIPIGHDATVVGLPYFDKGKLQMYFTIVKAYRVDLNHLKMQNAYLQTYDEKETEDADIYLPSSMLDLNTRIVTSDTPVTVSRSDFEIVGQKMVFNTQTHKGHMWGHVHMVIFNRQDEGAASPSPSPSPAAPAAPQ